MDNIALAQYLVSLAHELSTAADDASSHPADEDDEPKTPEQIAEDKVIDTVHKVLKKMGGESEKLYDSLRNALKPLIEEILSADPDIDRGLLEHHANVATGLALTHLEEQMTQNWWQGSRVYK